MRKYFYAFYVFLSTQHKQRKNIKLLFFEINLYKRLLATTVSYEITEIFTSNDFDGLMPMFYVLGYEYITTYNALMGSYIVVSR